MKKYYLLYITLFIGSFCFSQEQNTTNNSYVPVSIYTATYKYINNNSPSYASIKKNLNLSNSYKFDTVSFEDINSGRILISSKNFGAKSSKFIYDDYKSYRDENLLKGFLQKHDLTRWNPCNFRQPNVN